MARERKQLWEGNEADNEGGDDDDVTLSSIRLRSVLERGKCLGLVQLDSCVREFRVLDRKSVV